MFKEVYFILTKGDEDMKKFVLVFVMACMLIFPQMAMAYSVSLTDFEGRGAEAVATITGDGTNEITVELGLVDTVADWRGFFFNVDGDLSNFNIVGDDVTQWDASGNVTKLTNDVTMQGTKLSFDVGVEIGTQGMSDDDISSTTFTIYNDYPIDLGDIFGARLTSVGEDREDSSKLVGHAAVPIPAPIILLGTGLAALIGIRRKIK
jgi:hypothetical protein